MAFDTSYLKNRHFGKYGGRYVPEMLIPALDQLEKTYAEAKADPAFQKELDDLFKNYIGRPTPLYFAENLTKKLGGAKIYIKLEGLLHTGAHKINNCLGQILLARRMGKKKVIAETGAGQHGLATATVAAKFGFECKVFMGEIDMRRQYPNVYSMRTLGAEVVSVTDGTQTLKDAVNAALKYWIENLESTHYLLGSALGPFPYPLLVRDFHSVIGREVRAQIMEREGRLPDLLVACVGGGSNSLGLFSDFIPDEKVKLIGVEAGGRSEKSGDHAARFTGSPQVGVIQGYKSFFLQDEDGQVQPTHSISAGLDYAGVGPELAHLYEQGRVHFEKSMDDEVIAAYKTLARSEGIFAAMESSHAIAFALREAPKHSPDKIMVVNLSGRGDKDIFITAKATDRERWAAFLKEELARLRRNEP
ncbi:MAG: tryptophan synthase subunit beta [Spirochaetia bacterium]|nr:tryptophan synthase subunit beta [Spirochaetia bacterium]